MVPLIALMAGCGAQAPRPMPLAESGPVELTVGKVGSIADLQPGPVLTISRDDAMGYDEGKLAKDVADQFCAGRGRKLDRRAYGQFIAGAWHFKGGCA